MKKIISVLGKIYPLDIRSEIDPYEIASLSWFRLFLILLALIVNTTLMVVLLISLVKSSDHYHSLIGMILPVFFILFFLFYFPILILQMVKKYLHIKINNFFR